MHSPSNRQLDSTKPPGHDQTDLTDQIGPILKHWHHHSIVTTITMTIPPLLPPSLSPLFHPYHYRHLHTTIPPTPPPPALSLLPPRCLYHNHYFIVERDIFREIPRKKLFSAAHRKTASSVSAHERRLPRDSTEEAVFRCGHYNCGRLLLLWSLVEDIFRETPWKKLSSAVVITMSEEVDMDFQDEQDCGVNDGHVDCSDAFNTSQVFATREDVLNWARTVAHENGFVAVIMRSDTYTGSKRRTSFVLIGCERSGWTVKLICGIHNHELAKTLVGHPYAGRLTDDEKNIIADMTKSNVKPRNILLTLKKHNANSCTTIKQIYNARSAYRSSIRGDDTEMQHLMRLLERDQYIHWHRLKDQD
ncbi:hypothetical protein D0Y65_011614 [Glycine soja]|uniref:Protein FAR1-RELATED SEQUENCE n=1 Tax=Glycine soja TaxID=3848 RepID=A0A445KKX2_GLYSO|nr:hypothetical protein D0Y65_011614 [Glycine soja]